MRLCQVAQAVKNLPAKAGDMRCGFVPWVGKIPWKRKWQPTQVFLPGESHGGRSLVGYSPWGCKELDMTELLHFHFALMADRMKNHSHRKWIKLITWTAALSNSMKLWAMLCRATQVRWIMVKSSDKMWFTGGGNGKPLQYSCLENPMNGMKVQKDMTLKDELPRSVGAQYATGDQWKNNSRKNEETEPKQKQQPVVDMTGDGSKVWCCKWYINSYLFIFYLF